MKRVNTSGSPTGVDYSTTDFYSVNEDGSLSPSDSLLQKYGDLPNLSYFNSALDKQLWEILSSSAIPEQRKQALLAQLKGKMSNLPSYSWMDDLSYGIIGTSNYHKSMNQIGGQIGDVLSEFLQTDYEEDYNSAVQQAGREQQAGINTDLAGISGDAAGPASDINEMGNKYQSPESMAGTSVLSSFANVGLQAIQMITGFVGQVQGWISNDITNAVAEVGLDNALRDNIKQAFSAVAQDKDTLNVNALKYVRDNLMSQSERFVPELNTLEDLDKWIVGYNKAHPNSPVTLDDIYGSAILHEARNYENPYSTLRARRAYDRALKSISPNSPYVQSYIKSLEASTKSSELSTQKDQLQLQALLGDFGAAYRDSFKILQDAENEINEYAQKYYKARNGKVKIAGEDANGLPTLTEEDFIDLELQAEAQEIDTSRFNALATKYKSKLSEALRSTLDKRLDDIKKKSGATSWHYAIASIIYPALLSYLENEAFSQIGAMITKARPSVQHSTNINVPTQF